MTIALSGQLLLVGAGNMGGALLRGWLEGGLDPGNVVIQDPMPPVGVRDALLRRGLDTRDRVEALATPPAVIVLAVKPQIMDEVLPGVARLVGPGTLVLSVAAGRTLAGMGRHLPAGTALVRSIPNTPSMVGRGITVAVAGPGVTPAGRQLCDGLLRAVGEVAWVEDETLIDAATAVSGSGPAYVFLLAEALAAAGVRVGLEPELAVRLARATVAGAGELLHRSDVDAATLRQNVTSPNGTTAAALGVLMADGRGLPSLLDEAVAAAARRAKELAG